MNLYQPIVSGSLTVSGSIIASGPIIVSSGSISGTASLAQNSQLLGGLDSGSFAGTGSVSSLSSSFVTTSGSIAGRVTTIESKYATTGSNTFTNLQYISATTNAQGFTTTASLYTDGGLRVSKDSFVSGTAYFNNVVVYGTSSVQYLTSSQVNVGANIINLNTQTPAVRFGGMAVADSGSNAGITGSLLWDSIYNRWIYSNPSGSSYDGGMIISGPRNTTGLGNEVGTTACYLMTGQGGDHITSSAIYTDSNATCFYGGTSYISGSGAACFSGTMYVGGASTFSSSVSLATNSVFQFNTGGYGWVGYPFESGGMSIAMSSATRAGGSYKIGLNSNNGVLFQNAAGTTTFLDVTSTGVTCFSCQVCAPGGIITLNTTSGGFRVTGVAATPPNLAYLANNYFAKFYNRPDQNFGIALFDQSGATAIQSADLVNGCNPQNIVLNPYGANILIGTTSNYAKLGIGNICACSYGLSTFSTDWASGATTWTGIKIGAAADNGGAGVDIRAYTAYAATAGTDMALFTNTTGNVLTERLRITSAGTVCLGPTTTIGIQGGSDTTVLTGGSGYGSVLRMNYATGNWNNYLAGNGNNYFNCLYGSLNAAGGVKFANGASTLNYYEEGTWTPRIKAGTFTASPGASNVGWYTRVGNLVTVGGTLDWTGGSGAQDGSLQITCLPFTSNNSTNTRNVGQIGAPAAGSIGYVCTAQKGQFTLVVDPGNTFTYIIEIYQNGTYATYTHNPIVATSGTIYGFQATYHI